MRRKKNFAEAVGAASSEAVLTARALWKLWRRISYVGAADDAVDDVT